MDRVVEDFMDVALRAVVDLDGRISGAVRFARRHGASLAQLPAGVGFVREDPMVTEIVRHYLLDENAMKSFELLWEYRYNQTETGDGRVPRADLVLRPNNARQPRPWHYIEAKWWWWGNDYQRIQGDVVKLQEHLRRCPIMG